MDKPPRQIPQANRTTQKSPRKIFLKPHIFQGSLAGIADGRASQGHGRHAGGRTIKFISFCKPGTTERIIVSPDHIVRIDAVHSEVLTGDEYGWFLYHELRIIAGT